MSTTRDWPSVTCIMPVRDDAHALPSAVASILEQEYPGPLGIVIAVAPSRDGSEEAARQLASRDERVITILNPDGTTPAGLNRGIERADGEVIARVDARSRLGPGYLHQAVELLEETSADNVGGVQAAEGTTPFSRAVALAMTSRFGVGDARFHTGGDPGPTDTVYLGVFRREALERVGGFDEILIRNQDYELNYRLRRSGGIVYFDPRLRVSYEPRSSWRALASQYFQYGTWKRVVVRRHPRSLRWRQAVPPLAVLANLFSLLLALGGERRALAVPLAYVGAALVATGALTSRTDRARTALWLPLVFTTMHHAWGIGFLIGRPPTVTIDRTAPPAGWLERSA